MAKLIVDVTEGSLQSAYAEALFDEGKEALESNGYRIISLEEDARLRVQEGKSSSISQNGYWVREGFIYIPGKKVCIARHSPILNNAKKAVKCNRNGQFYSLTDEQVEKALSDSVEISYNQKPVPTNRFADEELTRFIFKEFAKEYGEFLKEAGVSEMPVYVIDEDYVQKQTKPFATQAWLRCVDNQSVLDGNGRLSLDYSYRLRGVKDNSQVESYTSKQIQEALNSIGISGGLEALILGKLQK